MLSLRSASPQKLENFENLHGLASPIQAASQGLWNDGGRGTRWWPLEVSQSTRSSSHLATGGGGGGGRVSPRAAAQRLEKEAVWPRPEPCTWPLLGPTEAPTHLFWSHPVGAEKVTALFSMQTIAQKEPQLTKPGQYQNNSNIQERGVKQTRPSKQCKSLIWILIFVFSVLICHREEKEGQLMVTPTNQPTNRPTRRI